MSEKKIKQIIKSVNLKVTPARIAILELLENSHKPLSVEEISKKVSGKDVNNVTIYRNLASFKEKGIVKEIYLHKDFMSYELSKHHHHHIVCRKCGDLEDFDICLSRVLVKKIERQSQKFAKIKDHSLEFFGECNKCLKYA